MQGIIATPSGDIWALGISKRQLIHFPKGDLSKGRIVCEGDDAEPCKSFKAPFHLGIDQQDRIWVSDGGIDHVTRFPAADPSKVETFKTGFSSSGLGIDSQGNVWVTNRLGSDLVGMFASQIIGRLLPYREMPAIDNFAERVLEETQRHWLCPLQPTLHPPGTALIRTLGGHSATCVALSGDGRLAVSASYGDKMLNVWDVPSGRELRTLTGHTDGLSSVALTPDGQRAVSASWDKSLKVWDVDSEHELRALTGHTGGIQSVALTTDGRFAVSASLDKTLKVWDAASGRELRTLTGHTGGITTVTRDGRRAISASVDKTLKVWDLEGGRKRHTLKGHSDYVNDLALSEDGRLAVSTSRDKTLKVWDMESGRELRTFEDQTDSVDGVALTPDRRRAVSASWDNTLKVWDVSEVRKLPTP